ncbi:MAG TPA: hypothetical protein PLD77_00160 [Candidatus Dojkabacteria bacterium]|nr:hypothetical protein [Candidatus Dojkabacteria bacterium]
MNTKIARISSANRGERMYGMKRFSMLTKSSMPNLMSKKGYRNAMLVSVSKCDMVEIRNVSAIIFKKLREMAF